MFNNFIWGHVIATISNSSLQVLQSHLDPCSSKCQFSNFFLQFHLRARRRKKRRTSSMRAPHFHLNLPQEKFKKYPTWSCHIFICSLLPQKSKDGPVSTVTFSSGTLPPQKGHKASLQLSFSPGSQPKMASFLKSGG